MLYADTCIGKLRVWFEHERGTKHYTICRLSNIAGDILTHGYAFCSTKDQFCKETGRKVALAHALKFFTVLDKADRTNIWREYHARTGRHNVQGGQNGI